MKAIQTLPGTLFSASPRRVHSLQLNRRLLARMKGGPHATLCISLRHRATPKDRLCGQVKRSLSVFFFRDGRLSCGSVRRREWIVCLDDYTNIMIYGVWECLDVNVLEEARGRETPCDDDAPWLLFLSLLSCNTNIFQLWQWYWVMSGSSFKWPLSEWLPLNDRPVGQGNADWIKSEKDWVQEANDMR